MLASGSCPVGSNKCKEREIRFGVTVVLGVQQLLLCNQIDLF